MAKENNLIVAPQLGFILGAVEATTGTAETLTIDDALYASEVSWSFDRENLTRTPLSPERPGVMSAPGAAIVSYSVSSEFSAPTISTSANVPHNDVLLRAGGFQSTFSDSADAFIYILTSSNHKSASFEIYEFEALGTKANKTALRGARHGWSIDATAGEIALLSCTGLGLGASTLANTYVTSTPASKTAVFYSDKPFICDGGHVEIVDLSDNSIYGGGSLGAPDDNYLVLGLTLDSGWTADAQRGLSADGASGRVRLTSGGPVTGTLQFETVQLASTDGAFDPYALRDNSTPLEVRVKFTHNTSDHLCFNFYCQIVGVDRSDDAGRSTWTCAVELRYPEDHDGDPAVGQSPERLFEYGATQGLFVNITPADVGVLAITYYSG